MPNSEYDNAHFFEEYAKMFRSQQACLVRASGGSFSSFFPIYRGKACWIWAAATAGIVNMLRSRALRGCLALT